MNNKLKAAATILAITIVSGFIYGIHQKNSQISSIYFNEDASFQKRMAKHIVNLDGACQSKEIDVPGLFNVAMMRELEHGVIATKDRYFKIVTVLLYISSIALIFASFLCSRTHKQKGVQEHEQNT